MKKIVIALGGNALLKKGQKPNFETQERNVKNVLGKLFILIKNNQVVITHGNGPQAGYLLLKQEVPLDLVDAETEGQIGYLIQQNLLNLFLRNNIKRDIVTILTQVLVDSEDGAFKNPSKFIGPFYTKSQADKLRKKFKVEKDSNRGWRRVVASPKPIKIIEDKIVKKLLYGKAVVIAGGGGGIPVVIGKKGFEGVECVVDKDLASEVLASSINADELIIITDVPSVYLNYGKKNQKKLGKVNLKDLKKYFYEGHFSAGSMGPKIEAAIKFLENGGKKVIITDIDSIGKRWTLIVR
ncbi:MAG: carbamate kinase [Candidatus Pacearchaeota archaeon]|nr:carbamate kinase [Candidatus Pacearchaeota archaeon]